MDNFLGTWRMVDYYFETSEDKRLYPWGKNPVGWFIVDAAGYMSAQIMHEERPQMDQPPSEQQAAQAYHSYVAYCGKTESDLDKKTLTTTVRGALNPDWVGGEQVREFSFEGKRLILKTPRMKVGRAEIRGIISWEKES